MVRLSIDARFRKVDHIRNGCGNSRLTMTEKREQAIIKGACRRSGCKGHQSPKLTDTEAVQSKADEEIPGNAVPKITGSGKTRMPYMEPAKRKGLRGNLPISTRKPKL